MLEKLYRTFFPKLPATVWVLFGSCVVNRMGTMVLPFLTLYVTRGLGYSAKEAGAVLACYGIGAVSTGPVAGWLSDRFGTVRLMLFSLVASGTVMLLFPLADSYVGLMVMTLALSLTNELYRPALFTVTSQIADSEIRRQAFAVVRVAVNIGMSIGPLVGGILATQASFKWLFYVDGITTFAAALMLWYAFIYKKMVRGALVEGSGKETVRPGIFASTLETMANPTFRFFWFAIILNSLVFFQFESTMPLVVVKDLGLTEQMYGFSFTINTVMIILFEIPLMNAVQRYSIHSLQAIGAFLIAVGFAAMGLVDSALGFCLTVVIWTLGEMILFPTSSAFVAENAPKERIGAYMGMYSTTFNVAHILGPLFGTFIWETWGTAWLCFFCLAVGIPSVILFWAPTRSQPKLSPQ